MNRLRGYARVLRSYTKRNVITLLYHRVADVNQDPFELCVTPDNFSEQMDALRAIGNPISLHQLNTGLRNHKLPRRGILLTFDDGYSDNLHNAKPILDRYEVPATVFVAGGYVGFRGEFWWDELENLLLRPGGLPEHLEFKLNGTSFKLKLGESAVFYSDEQHRQHQSWNVCGKTLPTERHALYLNLYKILRQLPPARRGEALQFLRGWSGCTSGPREAYRPMTATEVQRLRDGKLVEVGSHTNSHPVLSQLPLETQREEITGSKRLLEDILGQPITSFAYPYGGDADYTAETVGAVREAGFESAFSTAAGLVGKQSEAFRLPRYVVGNWNGDAFARRIRRLLYE
jgi:peptidoglycan/xylan/chitin deacetylase (PgdA/CDA1 family)